MEAHPDFDAKEVARTVALAVSTLHHRGLSSDSGNDETPLVGKMRDEMNLQESFDSSTGKNDDLPPLFPRKKHAFSGVFERIPARIILTVLGFLGFCNVYALRVNLSVAMVAMVNNSAMASNGSETEECPVSESSNSTIKKEGEFLWDAVTQSNILASFFFGYIVTQIPGGRMAELFGGKWLFGLGVFCTSVLTLLTPVVAHWGVPALITLRILEGLGEGVTFPAMHAMLGPWLPKNERSMLSTIIYSGAQIGTVISMPISGLLCDSDFLGGWPSVFYVFGVLGCLWFVFWCVLIYETPQSHPRISKAELLLIECNNDSDDGSRKKLTIPWKSILTSVPVWALILTHFGQNWGFYTLLTEMPTYLSAILHFSIKDNGFLSALPYLLQAVVSWVVSYIADVLRRKEYLRISTIRKLFNSIGFFGPAICLIGVNIAQCNHVASVICLTLALGFNGCIYSGFMVTHVDMSPDYAGTLMGMSNGFATLTGFLAPEVVGALTLGHVSKYSPNYSGVTV